MEGQVKHTSVTVIGGANMDICGSPAKPLVAKDSNPGHVTVRPGGVGRNIAHNLRLLGMPVSLITALGDDAYGAALKENCRSLGINLRMSLMLPGSRSSTYLYLTDEKGEMQWAINDMEIMRHLTPGVLAPHMEQINASPLVLVDANLPAETLSYLAERCRAPLYADPVSAAKARRMRGLLDRIQVIKPNRLEAEALTGEADPERAVRALLRRGVKRVFLSMGSEGMLAAEGDTMLHLPCVMGRLVSTNGAGDAAMAALVWAGMQGLDLERSARAALRAGAITCECAGANNPALAALPNDEELRR